MVYFGPSRGCETCKRRRKKCDETRPSCMRCVAADRTCGGYDDNGNTVFRSYEAPTGDLATPASTARKCSLPVRTADPRTNIAPDDRQPSEVSNEQIEQFALRAFFYDHCVISSNRCISLGYLHGLEATVLRQGQQAEVAKACKAVAFASHGIKLQRPGLTQKAERLYHEMLGFLARAIGDLALVGTAETLAIATLLGLYEIISAHQSNPVGHTAHARGVAAILQTKNSSSCLFGAVCSIRSDHQLVSKGHIRGGRAFSTLLLSHPDHSLDRLLLEFGTIWRDSVSYRTSIFSNRETLSDMKHKALLIDQKFATWQNSQSKDTSPTTAGHISQSRLQSATTAGHWPGRVDTYFDLYIASVWNTSRTARLLLINLILDIERAIGDGQDHTREYDNALHLVDDMVASIPYHLSEDLHSFLRDANNGATEIRPGRSVGGLLLMSPIYAVSNLSAIPQASREYLKRCLVWVGKNMGIGQACVLAKTPYLDEMCFADGCTIIWTGTLI